MAVQGQIEGEQEEGEREEAVNALIEESKKILDESIHSADLTDPNRLVEVTGTVIRTMCLLDQADFLNIFLKDTKYYIFDWAVRNHNFPVVNYLLESSRLSLQDRRSIVVHDAYLCLKVFVKDSLSLSYAEYQELDAMKQQILSKMISISPEDTVMFIKDEIHYRMHKENCTIEPEVYAAFKKTFKMARDGKRKITQYDIDKEIRFLEKVKRNMIDSIDRSIEELIEQVKKRRCSLHSENNPTFSP